MQELPIDIQPKSRGRRFPWLLASSASLALLFLAVWLSPPNSFHPTCTHTVNARISADVEIAGQRLSSSVVYQDSRSRQWIAMINSAGCKQLRGNALTYKLANDSVLIIPSSICQRGAQMLAKSGHVDILDACTGRQAQQDSAFIVDSATRPGKWFAASNGIDFRIVSMKAESTRKDPDDDIASIAPNLLKADFKYGRQQWSRSPEKVISFQRRYALRRDKPDQAYEFDVHNERFSLE